MVPKRKYKKIRVKDKKEEDEKKAKTKYIEGKIK